MSNGTRWEVEADGHQAFAESLWILPFFESGDADGFLFYVMPYVAVKSLRHRLAREKQPPPTATQSSP